MADSIVETIIVKLGLDVSSYNPDADKAVKKTDKLSNSMGKADDVASNLGKKLAKVFTTSAILVGIGKLVDEVAKLNDQLFFLEKNLGMSSQTIQAWQNAAGAMGGSADGMTNSMKSLNGALNDFVVMGDTSMLPYMNALGVSMVDVNGKVRDTDKVMLDLADSFSRMDREQAFSLASKMGLDEGTFNTLVQGREEMEKMIEYQNTMYKSSEAELRVSRDLQRNRALLGSQWQSMKTMMANALIPLFLKASEVLLGMFEYLQKHQEAVKAVFTGLAAALTIVLIPALLKATVAALAFIAPFAPFILVVGALGAAFGLLYNDYKVWAEGGKSLFDWGAFRKYIDDSTLSTSNLRNSFKNLTSEMINNAIPTLKGYAEIIAKLMRGDFKGAGAQAWEMMKNYSANVTNAIDDLTGQKRGTLANAAANLFGTANVVGGASSGGMSGGSIDGGSNPLLELLNKGETGGKSGSAAYSTPFSGMRIKAPKPLTEMTIGEVKQWQKANINEQKSRGIPADRRSSAAGRYQIIYTSMGGYQAGAGLSDNDLFSQENQDKMAMAMMRNGRFGLDAVKAGRATPQQFLDNILAPQWASVQNSRGQGQHNAKGFNHASITPAQSYKAIQDYLSGSSGAGLAMQSMQQGTTSAPRVSNSSTNKNTNVDVKIDNINVKTSADTLRDTSMAGIQSGAQQLFMAIPASR